MKHKRFNKKSQVWISDYTISMLLFIIAALLSVKIVVNGFSLDNEFQEIRTDASEISEILFSEGYPSDWHNDSVIRPGLFTGKKLNSTKIFNAMNLNYSSIKPKLQTRHDFLIIFEDPDKDMIEFDNGTDSRCAIGSSDVTINSTPGVPFDDCHNPVFTSINPKNLVKLTRLAVYDTGSESKIIKMVVYAWR